MRATDAGGQWADATLVVNVSAGDAGSSGAAAGGTASLPGSRQPASDSQDELAPGTGATITTIVGNGVYGYAGDGGAAAGAQLGYPTDVAVDQAGDLFIADYANSVVREVAHGTGVITTLAGNGICGFSGDGGQATAAELNCPADWPSTRQAIS